MANWAWPHTPSSRLARLMLTGGPFDGHPAGFVPADLAPPVQIVWAGWMPWGFDAWLYEWRGEGRFDRGRTDALVFHATGRRLAADEIPPLIAETAAWLADSVAFTAQAHDVSPELISDVRLL